jgi:hypothetical protein
LSPGTIIGYLPAPPEDLVDPLRVALLAAAKPWHYWLSVVLAASFVGLVFLLVLGYVVRVVMAKYGIRVGRR